MNQTDIKRVLTIFVGLLITLCVETCQENQFQLPDLLCCMKCPEGMYVAKNCSRGAGVHFGVRCDKCRRCEDIGQITVSSCMLFSDTQCDMERRRHIHLGCLEGQLSQKTLYGCLSVVVAVFMLAVIMAICFIRIRKSGESDKSSAGEPFHVKDAETV